MNDDFRMNWQMPATSPGPKIRRVEVEAFDPLAWFSTDEHLPGSAGLRLLCDDVEDMLPEGICEGAVAGEYEANCVCCEQRKPIFCGLDEIPATGYRHYCNGSERCCP